jgi:ornithine--oxo-acid transaminase
LICDEVQTGFGRTGKMLGSEWDLGDGVRPDMITLGKAISAGVTPVSGILASDEVMMTVGPGDHGSTYGGNALGMAIAQVAVQCLVEEDMIGNSMRAGAHLEAGLRGLKSPLIKEVRARGLF